MIRARSLRRTVAFLISIATVTTAPSSIAQDTQTASVSVRTQEVQIEPAIERGSHVPSPAVPTITVPDRHFSSGTTPDWIWGEEDSSNYVLSTVIELPAFKAARIKASCDNEGTIYVNGKRVASSSEWQDPMDVSVTANLQTGSNLIEAEVSNSGGIAAFVLKLVVIPEAGEPIELVSGDSWTVAATRGEKSTVKASLRGRYGEGPWNSVFENAGLPGRVPPGVFEVLPGFQVEKLFTVPKDELGSWVCLAVDQKGRLLVSDQGDLGICRVTPASVSASDNSAASMTSVEKLDFSRCQYKPTAAQGMLWAFDSLYLSINGGPGSGLYRARDLDGDDVFDECIKLKDFAGGGEHGPHSLRLSPDGTRIFVICGNHTLPPFQPGDEQSNKALTSKAPTSWNEDHLLPRMWDANGHAVGILAPGGWIASTDPDGNSWDIWSIGYRNPYDMAFNADGELFAYDADMEWDVGMPWYRPTRVVHASSGSEFGWRSGSGKWPVFYQDSLPPLVNIGPGSPVGVDFGYGLAFPTRYQKCLYICDWTFGTMYAIHMTPNGSSYTAVKEEFVSRTPLPLTDVVAGSDGMLYFTIGGRGTQSELFRVRYVGTDSTELVDGKDSAGLKERSLRKSIESQTVSSEVLIQALNGDDRHLAMSAMRAVQNGHELAKTASRLPLLARIRLLTALITRDRKFEPPAASEQPAPIPEHVAELRRKLNQFLDETRLAALTVDQQQEVLRLASLGATRLGMHPADFSEAFQTDCSQLFPAEDAMLNRELSQMLVFLQSPGIAGRLTKLLEQPPVPTVTDDMQDLLARNRGYGGAIAASITNAPDQQQIWYAFVLRNLKNGWTLDDRKAFFGWFERAHEWKGGASYHGFLRNIEKEAFENASEKERLLIEASGARKPYVLPELPKPTGPGKEWMLEEVRSLAETGLKDRNFENGLKMFAAARCVLCHRFGGDGGATGPDLTQLAGRFNVKDLTEAIMDPSKVISDQYKGSTIVTKDGEAISGRIVAENETSLTILTNPEDSTKIRQLSKAEIDELQPSTVSIMPAGLLKPLNEEEVLDLLAYLLSRGDQGHPMFRR